MVTIPYRMIENALATSYGIDEPVRAAGFRSMIANLQKLGALGADARVGRGAPLDYTPEHLHRLVVALELSELGLPPATAVTLISRYWEPQLKDICWDAEANNSAIVGGRPINPADDVVVVLGGVGLRTSTLKGSRVPMIPSINKCRLADLAKHMQEWMIMEGPNDALGLAPRALITNLSARFRSVHGTLVDENFKEMIAEGFAAARKASKHRRRKK
jgi:hypothetical protein